MNVSHLTCVISACLCVGGGCSILSVCVCYRSTAHTLPPTLSALRMQLWYQYKVLEVTHKMNYRIGLKVLGLKVMAVYSSLRKL